MTSHLVFVYEQLATFRHFKYAIYHSV